MESRPPLHLGVVAIEKGAFRSPSSKIINFTYIYILWHCRIYEKANFYADFLNFYVISLNTYHTLRICINSFSSNINRISCEFMFSNFVMSSPKINNESFRFDCDEIKGKKEKNTLYIREKKESKYMIEKNKGVCVCVREREKEREIKKEKEEKKVITLYIRCSSSASMEWKKKRANIWRKERKNVRKKGVKK